MKTYEGANVRNVAVIGHSHSGKTSLVSALLFTAGSTPRLGRVDERIDHRRITTKKKFPGR